jgi:hypothetical protein
MARHDMTPATSHPELFAYAVSPQEAVNYIFVNGLSSPQRLKQPPSARYYLCKLHILHLI